MNRVAEGMRLEVGDPVVYPGHGAGRVVARGQRAVIRQTREVVVLELVDGLSVTLPAELARRALRPLLGDEDLRLVKGTLQQTQPDSKEAWTKRLQHLQKKLAVGEPVGLAEIVRNTACRERKIRGKRGALLSASENSISMKARRLLSGEIAFARGIEPAEAGAWIDKQLDPTRGR